MTTAADGTNFTGTVTCYVTLDAGAQGLGSVGSGVCTHEGNGYHTYAPAQAETNGDLAAFTFIGTGAISATVQVFTSFPQTGDAYAETQSGTYGLSAIKTETASILTDTAEIGAAGAGLTNINLPNQTMDIVGNITGNLSGSVGSVTGAVGSVTGAVGSVTGLTASDVAAIKAKTDGLTYTVAGQVDSNVQYVNDVQLNGDGAGTPMGV